MFEWLRNVFVNEEIKQFKNKSDGLTDKQAEKQSGEGLEVLGIDSGYTDISSFNLFYNSKLNQTFKNNRDRYKNYRSMATMPEIIDIIEDAVNESTQEDDDGNILNLKIVNEKIENSENINKVLYHEFDELFNKTLDINTELWRYVWNFMVDGCIYYERIINISNAKQGIKGIKLLPPESMDYIFNYQTNKVEAFLQYIQERTKRPSSIEEARQDKNIVVFIPEQIGFIPYRFGKNKNEIIGFLENCKVAYNQLKLLEAAVIVYRLVRAPERFVFKIDVGNMPKDKALRYVNKIKQQMNRKQTYDPNTGTMDGTVNVQCIRQNTEIKLLDGRSVPLIDLVKEYKDGKENWVYSINQKTKEIQPNKIINAAITRKNEKLVRIHLDDGSYHDTTYDHKWILRNGEEVEAQDLKIGNSLMPLYTSIVNLKNKGKTKYESFLNLRNNKWELTHKMVCEKTQRKRELNEEIHHIDHNSFNNYPNNLKFMDRTEHRSYHSKYVWEHFTEEEKIKRNKNVSNGWKKRLEDSEKLKEWQEHTAKWNKKLNKIEKLHEGLNKPENRAYQKKRASETSKEYWSDENNRKTLSYQRTIEIDFTVCDMFAKAVVLNNYPKRDDLFKILKEDGKLLTYWKSIQGEDKKQSSKLNTFTRPLMNKILDYMKIKDYPTLKETIKNFPVTVNHKISKIEYLNERDDTGCITVENNHNFAISYEGQPTVFISNSVLDNIYIPQSDNRGSDVETIGGNSAGFTELDDVKYFAKKLFRALKYPMSRVDNMLDNRNSDVLFQGSNFAEIARDEIKWSKFLERMVQNKFSAELKDLFLLHLKFKGLKKQYNLNRNDIAVSFNPPSEYREQMKQQMLEVKLNNYSSLSNEEAFSKSYLMKKYLGMDEEEIKENSKGFDEDKKLFPQDDRGF